MEEMLRIGLMLVAAIVFFLIGFDAWLRRRRYKMVRAFSVDNHLTDRHQEPSVSTDCSFHLPISEEFKVVSAAEPVVAPPPSKQKENDPIQDLIVLSVFAKPNCQFGSYDLLQAITATGMQYGEMNIFHYYVSSAKGKSSLFSLASATKPGEFNLDRMGELTCVGLTLFMDLTQVTDPKTAFDIMLKTAEQLSEDLEGELRAGLKTPWNSTLLQQYQHKIMQFQQRNLH